MQRASSAKHPFVYTNEVPLADVPPKRKHACLLMIDNQIDFCGPFGALMVPGATQDAANLITALDANRDKFDGIIATLDTHQQYHIAHPIFWVNGNKEHPRPYTMIRSSDLEAGTWQTTDPLAMSWAKHYLEQLEKRNKFRLIIWPPHCLVGSLGHAIYSPIQASLQRWELAQPGRNVQYVQKGNNAFTEHYSAISAEVVVENDPNTKVNTALLNELNSYEKIFVAGQALSHCVNFTVKDMIANGIPASKIYLIRDACSNVEGFQEAGNDFLVYFVERQHGNLAETSNLKEYL